MYEMTTFLHTPEVVKDNGGQEAGSTRYHYKTLFLWPYHVTVHQ